MRNVTDGHRHKGSTRMSVEESFSLFVCLSVCVRVQLRVWSTRVLAFVPFICGFTCTVCDRGPLREALAWMCCECFL